MVEKRHWLTATDFTETIGLCLALPGPNIGNASIVLGKRWFGLVGAVVAFLALFALPYLWVLVLALVYTRWAAHPLVSAVVTGVGAFIFAAGYVIATPHGPDGRLLADRAPHGGRHADGARESAVALGQRSRLGRLPALRIGDE